MLALSIPVWENRAKSLVWFMNFFSGTVKIYREVPFANSRRFQHTNLKQYFCN